MKPNIEKMRASHNAHLDYLLAIGVKMPPEEIEKRMEVSNSAWEALTEEEKETSIFFDANNLW